MAVYTRPRDRHCPLVCLDETSKQLLAETRVAIPMRPGRPVRCDYEYERNGTANLFMLFAPLEGWRRVKVTDRHTAVDYAHVLRDFGPMSTSQTPKQSFWSRTISTPTAGHRFYDTLSPGRRSQEAWSSASRGTSRQSTAVGLTWRNPNLAFCRPNASPGASPTNKPSSTKSGKPRLGARPQRQSRHGQLALLQRQTPKASNLQAPLPFNLTGPGDLSPARTIPGLLWNKPKSVVRNGVVVGGRKFRNSCPAELKSPIRARCIELPMTIPIHMFHMPANLAPARGDARNGQPPSAFATSGPASWRHSPCQAPPWQPRHWPKMHKEDPRLVNQHMMQGCQDVDPVLAQGTPDRSDFRRGEHKISRDGRLAAPCRLEIDRFG